MKLIHLPTGEEIEANAAYCPKTYIRAELPEYWRVEGYDKSWEWAGLDDPTEIMQWVYFNWNKIAAKGCCEVGSIIYKDTEPISRAEFEHHIYNPWKQGKDNPTKPDIETVRALAAELGMELVPVKKEPIAWDMEENSYVMHDGGVTIKDESDQKTVWLENAEIETLIEKYNQFHATPTT